MKSLGKGKTGLALNLKKIFSVVYDQRFEIKGLGRLSSFYKVDDGF